jgi:hypothetical protein
MSGRNFFATVTLVLAGTGFAEEPPGALDLEEALARQAASDLISGVAVAYDCAVAMHSMRQLGTEDQPVYLVQVSMSGSECEDALLLLARHGSTKDFVFRRWEPGPDVQRLDPATPPPQPGFDMDDGADDGGERP